jgi:acetoin:2,6-dichlorophenolindophenol oxidoreductase subunit beta
MTTVTHPVETRELTYIQAVNEALRWALRELPDTLVFGEDVAKPGGPFGATRGLYPEFGAGRIFDTPISESAILGAAVGASMRGLRPIVEIMFMDFSLVALDQIVNQAANVRYVSKGAFAAPMTIRTQQGATPGSCAQHSQCLEAFFAHTPGLRVAAPAIPQDAYDLLRTAIVEDDPTLVIESRALYRDNASVTVNGEVGPIDGPRVRRAGSDVTIVSWARMLYEATAAADELAERGVSAEVIDLRWLAPLRLEVVLESLAKTGRLLVAHEANLTGGFGAEVVARICNEGFDLLDAPAQRVGARDVRVPASPTLQSVVLPAAADIVSAADSLVSY